MKPVFSLPLSVWMFVVCEGGSSSSSGSNVHREWGEKDWRGGVRVFAWPARLPRLWGGTLQLFLHERNATEWCGSPPCCRVCKTWTWGCEDLSCANVLFFLALFSPHQQQRRRRRRPVRMLLPRLELDWEKDTDPPFVCLRQREQILWIFLPSLLLLLLFFLTSQLILNRIWPLFNFQTCCSSLCPRLGTNLGNERSS